MGKTNQHSESNSSLRTKIFAAFALMSLFVSGILTIVLYENFRGGLRDGIRERLGTVAALAALQINPALHDSLTEPSDEGNAAYRSLQTQMQAIQAATPDVRYVYTMREGPGGEIRFVVDAETNPELIAHLDEVYDEPGEALAREFATLAAPLVEEDFYTDKFGTHLSGYAPFVGATGQRSGVVGIDISADNIIASERRFLFVALTVFLSIAPLLLLASWLLSRRLTAVAVKATEALRESEAQLKAQFNTSFESIFLSEKGVCLDQNETAERMFGYTVAEAVGRPGTEWIVPDDRARVKDNILSGYEKAYEVVALRKDGTTFSAEIQALPLKYKGRAIRMTALRDITERKRTEERMRLQATVLDQISDCVTITGLDGTITYVNEASRAILDLDLEELIRQTTEVYGEDPERGATQQEILESTLADGHWEGEVVNTSGDGRDILMHCRTKIVYDDAGKPLCLVGVSTDITDKAEQEKQLEQSRKMESVGRLAGGVAHDFNNLLMGIMGYIDLCRTAVEPDHPIHQWLDEITSDAQRSASLTRQLLTFSRREPVTPQVLDTNDRISSMLKMLRHLIGENMKLVWQPGPVAGRIKMAPSHIEQIVVNLSVNARDAIGSEGSGKIEIATHNAAIDADYCSSHSHATPGDYVLLAVSDNGCGMDAETLEHVFEPFFTTKGSEEGTGLGLATVYGIVEGNGGFIDIDTEPGRGTTFHVYLPRVEGEVVPEPAADSSVDSSEAAGGDETILLVEDEKSIRVTVRLFLQDMGYTVLAAESPKAALELVAAHTTAIDLLITDVIMPGMNGRELADQLGAEFPDLKVLFISGYSGDAITRDGILDEGVEFLPKPITRDRLAVKLREMLDT